MFRPYLHNVIDRKRRNPCIKKVRVFFPRTMIASGEHNFKNFFITRVLFVFDKKAERVYAVWHFNAPLWILGCFGGIFNVGLHDGEKIPFQRPKSTPFLFLFFVCKSLVMNELRPRARRARVTP